ncbi:ubiquitin-associated protein 2-like isoform X1 [Sardina pilchardus]|uniref:ubiquitin-associated protein 2-like isoform X1 n=1 Tax=Sardina pilchardus TaxID=27697 RepID=UPI002E13987F
MMTALVNDPSGVNPSLSTHTSHQKQIQATAEQIRLAQMIYDKNDAEFEDKVKQLVEVTGRSQDECMVALHDCNEDVNRAINLLLEGVTDQSSWETVGKRRGLGKDGASEPKDNREKRGERDTGRGRAAARRGRGASRSREVESGGMESSSRRGRGRGAGGARGRGRGTGVSRFSSQGMGTFNPADYGSASAHTDTGEGEVNGGGAGGPWRNAVDDWAAEDWSEDLSVTKVFTSSAALAGNTHLTSANSMDLCTLMSQTAEGAVDADPEPLGQSLVFTNSQHTQAHTRTATHSYAAAASSTGLSGASAVVTKVVHPEPVVLEIPGSGSLRRAEAPPSDVPTETLTHTHTHFTSSGSTHTQTQTPSISATSESKTSRTTAPTHIEVPPQPEPSAILSQHALQQSVATPEVSHPALPEGSSLGAAAGPEAPAPLRHSRPPRRRPAPPSKIPSSAVEMPGSADVSGLNVQFGALDFASEPITMETTQPDSSSDSTQDPIPQNSLPPRSASDSMAASLDSVYPAPSRGLPNATGTPSSTQRVVPSAQDATPLTNGFSEVRSSSSTVQDTLKSDITPQSSAASPATTPSHSVSMTALSSTHVSGSAVSSSSSLTMPAEAPMVSAPAGAPGLTPNGSARSTAPPSAAPGKTLPPMMASQYIMSPGGLLPAYPQIYGYEDMQMMQSRMPVDYYGVTYPATTATMPGRDGVLASNPYSGETTKFGRGDSASPVPPTSLSSAPPPQAAVQQSQQAVSGAQSQQAQTQAQAFLSPPLPPGYSYPAMPYYPAMPGTFQYPLLMPANAKQPTQYAPYTGFDDLSQAAEFSKGYGGSAQTQPKGANSTGKGNSGVPDMSAYTKTQSYEKAGFHTATPPPFSLPSALGGATAYGHTPFLHILPAHQQPHSQMMQGVPGQRSQNSGLQQKSGKSSYSNSAYWAN